MRLTSIVISRALALFLPLQPDFKIHGRWAALLCGGDTRQTTVGGTNGRPPRPLQSHLRKSGYLKLNMSNKSPIAGMLRGT